MALEQEALGRPGQAAHLEESEIEALRGRILALEALTEHIPAGVHQCKNDDGLTLVSMSSSFCKLFGFTREEIEARFHNRFLEMVCPDDREQVRLAMGEQLTRGSTVELEYQVQRKDGTSVWIMDKGRLDTLADGTQYLYCVMLDIDSQKREREALRLSMERYQIILNQTTDIIFEWDIEADTLSFSTNWRKKFGYEPARQNISQALPRSSNIHPDDMSVFLKLMQDAAAGIPYSEVEFRIQNSRSEYRWCRIRATVQFSHSGRPLKAVGLISDIDTEKKRRDRLVAQAQTDSLTGLYNKATIQELVSEKAGRGKGSYQMLMIIDVDNFKLVNDTYGHMCGDSLLSDLAAVLKRTFRTTDLVGRIGGDEFLVYLPQIDGKTSAESKAQAVLSALKTVCPQSGGKPISCSIGIAFFPQSAGDYYALYKCADRALYSIKSSGKNGYRFYDPKTCSDGMPCGLARSAISETIDSEVVTDVDQQLAQFTFQMLYKAMDTETAVNELLEIVGRAYNVSRAYIYESSEDGLQCSNTFEWCAASVRPAMGYMQNLAYQEDLGGYLGNFNQDGVFYCRDIGELKPQLRDVLKPQGVCALLQCAIMDGRIFRGYVGFDECRENRRWTKQQMDSLALIANVLTTFLLKLRCKERIIQLEEKLARPLPKQ